AGVQPHMRPSRARGQLAASRLLERATGCFPCARGQVPRRATAAGDQVLHLAEGTTCVFASARTTRERIHGLAQDLGFAGLALARQALELLLSTDVESHAGRHESPCVVQNCTTYP